MEAFGAPFGYRVGGDVEAGRKVVPEGGVLRREDRDDPGVGQRLGETVDRAGQYGLPAQQAELLGQLSAAAAAPATISTPIDFMCRVVSVYFPAFSSPAFFAGASAVAGAGSGSESSCVMRSSSFTSPLSSSMMRSRTYSKAARFSFAIGSAGS